MMNNLIFVAAFVAVTLSLESSAQTPGRVDSSTIHTGANAPANYIKNPSGFDNALGITVSSATIARDASGSSDLLDGKASLVCDASSQNGYCEFDTNTIQEGDKTGSCEEKALFKGDASLYKLQVTDGSNVLTSSPVLSNATDWTEVSINYPCGATRKVRLTQTEAGTGAAVNIGRVYHGRATNLGVANSISNFRSFTPTGTWITNTTYTGYWRQVGDSAEIIYHVALAGAPTSATLTVDPPSGLTIDNTKAPTGTIVGAAGVTSAGTSYTGRIQVVSNTLRPLVNTSVVNATTPGTFTSGDTLEFTVLVPIQGWGSQTVVNDNITPWYVDATMDGDSFDLGVAAVTSYTETTAASITLKPQSGTAPVGVMCSGTNAAVSPSTSNTVCPSSNESAGINFSIPKSGAYEVCVYGNLTQTADSGEELNTTLQLIETPTNAQTLTLEGGTRQFYRNIPTTIASGVDASIGHPISNCSIFNWASNGTKGVRLMYEQAVSGTPDASNIIADANANNGQRNLRWTVKPVTAASPMPLLTGSVTSNSIGLERVERATISCSGTSSITRQSGSWISSVGNVSSGNCALTIASGIFSAAPTCHATVDINNATFVYGTHALSNSATSVDVGCRYLQSGSSTVNNCSSNSIHVTCVGPR